MNDNFQNPIFVAMDEIECHDNTFSKSDKQGFITITPKHDVLHGYRCTDLEPEAIQLTIEHCGKLEPDKWMSRLDARFRNGCEVKISTVEEHVRRDQYDSLRQPVRCFALIPQKDGTYIVVGSRHTTIEFFTRGWWSDSLKDITHFELASYQPAPRVFCRVNVTTTDCTAAELTDHLTEWVVNE